VADVFISYKKERKDHARRLAAVLEAYGYEVWWDYGLLVDAGDYDVQIEAKLTAAKAVIVLWCSGACASSFVKDEARRAKDAGKLAPALIEAGVEPPLGFGGNEMAFLLNWLGDPEAAGVLRLVDALERLTGQPRRKRPNTIEALKDAKDLPAVTPMHVVDRADTNAPPRGAAPPAASAGPSFADLKAIWAKLETTAPLARVLAFYEEFAKPTPLRFEVEHRIEALEAEEAARRQREEEERRLGPAVVAAREAAKVGRPVAERAFPIELPGVAGWPAPKMIAIPPGTFLMGSPPGEKGRDSDEGPQREVRFAYGFALGQHAVTFAEWDAAIAAGAKLPKPDDAGWGRGTRPVITVSWEDAQAFLAWLNAKAGLTGRADAYRLPSEAEWEYACRAGTTTPFSFGATISTAQANYDGNCTYGAGKEGEYREKTMPVGSFPANPFGLHEMHGNCWEWCEDCWNSTYSGLATDGSAITTGDCSNRVYRGGSWLDYPKYLRSANRIRITPTVRYFNVGFRLSRTLSSCDL
jgi:formylglycine-generating enzyme required for sulfatase activity